MAKEVGDRAGEGVAYGNLGNAYDSLWDYCKAIEYHGQHLAIAQEVGDRAGEGRAYGNLGNAYRSQGGFSKAIECHGQHLAIAKEVGDRAGEGGACGNLGTGHVYLNDKAVAYFEAQHAMAISLKLAHEQSHAAMNLGVALTLHVRAAREGTATGADQAPGPHSHSSASACLNDRAREAAKWLKAAFDGGRPFAKLHLAHLTLMRAKRTRRWHISKSTSRGVCNGDVTLAPTCAGGKRGARTRRCSRAAVAV
jgi:tetratricopeptide (TPR) repeat protein